MVSYFVYWPFCKCGTVVGHAIAVIIVVCIGFLMLMIALGVIRIRAAHHRATQEEIQETEMAWDDSALNIIVNPMEVITNLTYFINP